MFSVLLGLALANIALTHIALSYIALAVAVVVVKTNYNTKQLTHGTDEVLIGQ